MNIYDETKQKLDEISPTFCVAKWKQVTMHLESGLTHSCHHPRAHTVPLDELEENVSALHNTKYKKRIRKEMLDGNIVPECDYCNRIEQKSKNTYSDRIYKSADFWAVDQIPEIVSNPWDYDVFPTYFEVSFSSICNCSCIYCSPTFSSGWKKEIEKFGGYPTSISTRDFRETPPPTYDGNKNNPYLKAFWKWWPDLYKNLKVFRITGGEPLLDKNLFKIMDFLIENPKPDLKLGINSNLCIPDSLLKKFIEKCKILTDKGFIVSVFTSCEAYRERAEYIRPGLNYYKWLDNCQEYLDVSKGRLTLMSTYNILSITSFEKFLEHILGLKTMSHLKVLIDIPHLVNPTYLQANIITKDFIPYIRDSVTYMYRNPDVPSWPPLSGLAFFQFETEKLKRIFHIVEGREEDENVKKARKDFQLFIDEHDRRYGSNFVKIFPEMENFYNLCKEIKI